MVGTIDLTSDRQRHRQDGSVTPQASNGRAGHPVRDAVFVWDIERRRGGVGGVRAVLREGTGPSVFGM